MPKFYQPHWFSNIMQTTFMWLGVPFDFLLMVLTLPNSVKSDYRLNIYLIQTTFVMSYMWRMNEASDDSIVSKVIKIKTCSFQWGELEAPFYNLTDSSTFHEAFLFKINRSSLHKEYAERITTTL